MSEHTKEPWWNSNLEIGNDPVMSVKIAKVSGANFDEAIANAYRIVACVNACTGIENSELDAVSYTKLLESHQYYEAQLDAQSELNKELVEAFKDYIKCTKHLNPCPGTLEMCEYIIKKAEAME